MFLKRIELQGFKSFADKTIIQFENDITGIVGPNGCGKSNVNDAIRWVLGEQSVKSLRSGTSMSDIIFSGSEYRKPVNMAKVTLVFDNSTKVFDSPFEEIEITRALQRSTNEASYYINKTPCRLKDISDLVMDTGLGRDSLSIITQGNISSFADAKPEDRRSLFEEAAGVAKYKKRKKVSLNKLNQTQENLDRLQDILDELERQIGPLSRQAKKAEKFTELKEELSKIEISVLAEEIESLDASISELKKSLFKNKAIYASKDASLTKQDLDIFDLRKEMHALDDQINELQGEYTKAMQESNQLEKRKVELDQKRKYALQMADSEQRKVELTSLVDEAKFEYEDRKKRFDKLKAKLDLHTNNLNTLRSKVTTTDNEYNQENDIYQQLLNRKQVLENMAKEPYQHQAGVRSVNNAKKSLSGIEGVVSELLVPTANMANAIGAALGASMYHIVCRDEKSAREAIRFLKRNKSGRATFLPMTVCQPKYASDNQQIVAKNCAGFIDWACNLIECDEKYIDVCDRLLGNVLVIDTLENANEAAKMLKYQIKIVTLDGDIVHTGGSMTGGTTKNQSTPLTIKQQLDSIESQIEGQKLKVDNLKEEKRVLDFNIDEESETCHSLQIEQAKLENILATKKQKYESYVAELNQLGGSLDIKKEFDGDDIVVQVSKMHAHIDEISSNMQTLRQRRFNKGSQVEEMENQVRLTRREMNSLQNEIHQDELKVAQLETHQENALTRLNTDYQMTYETAQNQKEDIDLDVAKERVLELRSEISKLGNVNLDAPKEYAEVKERFDFMSSQKEDLVKASEQILAAIDEMDKTMTVQFKEMFDKINSELDGIFKSMFGGGKASLSMVDPDDILNTGIDIDVQPPGKLVKNIQAFSGGEKALIAISVLFAILKARTMPLCIFDEVEAALDQANVERFAKYLSKYRGQSQFIVVTHRPGTMEQCDTLYGVTMQKDGVSKLLRVHLKDAIGYTKKEEN